jgi:hypothetical protein
VCFQNFLTFAVYNVIEDLARFELTLYECEYQVFVAVGKYKALKRLAIPRNIFDTVDVVFGYSNTVSQ